MKSVLASNGTIVVRDSERPVPGAGQILVKSRACGICGSDLHVVRHGDDLRSLAARLGLKAASDGAVDIPLGHEFVAEIVEFGPETDQTLRVGDRVCALPFLLTADGQKGIGADPELFGAYSEYFLTSEPLLLPVPAHVSDEAAALVEPVAVAVHAVARSSVGDDQVALVVGCGPIGLATITALRLRGIRPILAVDPVAGRRELARKMGADEVLEPAAGGEMARLQAAAGDRPTVIYECVGRPEIVSALIDTAPPKARVVFVGLCTHEVSILPFIAMMKELDLAFAYYYTAEDFQTALEAVSAGKVDWKLWVTGKVGFDGVAGAFDVLSRPNEHVKILVEPWRQGTLPA